MSAEMPERIWIDRSHGKHAEDWTWTPDATAQALFTEKQLAEQKAAYVRASTHQRVIEALEQVLDDSRYGLSMAPATRALALYAYAKAGGAEPKILEGLDAATAMLTELGYFGSRAALAAIKEHTP